MQISQIPEPNLIFGDNGRCFDPKLGILLHGPFGWKRETGQLNPLIIAGAIGTQVRICRLREVLGQMRNRIGVQDKGKPWKREFPGMGIKSLLHFDIQIPPGYEEPITKREEDQILSQSSRQARIMKACEVYEGKLNQLVASIHPRPLLVFYPLSRDLIESTRDPRYESDRIVYARRKPEEGEDLRDIPLFNFHHFLKVIGFPHKIPSQIVLPSTFDGSAGKQDFATVAWNFSVAAFYKATHTPWKLADLDEGTCYVGISFFDEIESGRVYKRAAMAHVYLKTGESQIIRGKSFPWSQERWKSPQLDAKLAADILSDVIALYRSQKGKGPNRVVVHKSSQYSDDEIIGFADAAGRDCYLDLVHIHSRSLMRFFLRGSGFPPIRGTLVEEGTEDPAYLYTTGYLPGFATYMGSGTPWPLEFHCDRLDTDLKTVASDIMALTKLDWNNTEFCTSQPVTMSVSRKVGGILAESRARNLRDADIPQSYSFYM
jgi:hypothetical protein